MTLGALAMFLLLMVWSAFLMSRRRSQPESYQPLEDIQVIPATRMVLSLVQTTHVPLLLSLRQARLP